MVPRHIGWKSSQLKCHVGVTLFSSSIFSVGSHSGTFIVLAMAIRSDFNKTFRRIARLFYWCPKSLTCSKNRKSKLVWSQGRGKLSQANASFQILFFFSVTKMEPPSSMEKKVKLLRYYLTWLSKN